MPDGEPILRVANLSKTFAGTRALDSVDLDVLSGEVHGLLGQNGSGKSTLIKLLSGVYEPDEGATVEIRGERVQLPLGPGESRKRGVGFVHQDLALVPGLSILENLRTDGFLTGIGGRIRWRAERARTREALRSVGLDVDPELPVSALSAAQRAMVALARSLDEIGHERGLLVLDEPTAYLPRHDVEELFGAVREVTARGCGVLFVSHRLDEVLSICDRVTILRDGRKIDTTEVAGSSEAKLMAMIVGRELERLEERAPTSRDESVLAVRDLTGKVARGVSFDLNRGEIVGLTGLVGMGHDEVPYLLTGAFPPRAGAISLAGEPIAPTPRRAARAGMVLLPANRAEQSGIGSATLRENVSLPVLGGYYGRGWLDQRRERSDVQSLVERFGVRPPQPDRPFSTFSGGNQQKALLAKWLQLMPRVLILHEPTHGVDVGAKRDVIEQISSAAAAGVSVLVVSSEAEDLVKMCERVHVFNDGAIVSTLSGEEVTEERIIERCYATARA
ncbi:MAG TPA: sugar ABC transporter ATP-binding protein [Solirubrobacterales bacterium]|nr:sugar ABC transporter ATP-binding protein [Solirubrobacterales bacterium]